jgi:hypothetical protein
MTGSMPVGRKLPAVFSSAVGRTEGEFFSGSNGKRAHSGKPGKKGGLRRSR